MVRGSHEFKVPKAIVRFVLIFVMHFKSIRDGTMRLFINVAMQVRSRVRCGSEVAIGASRVAGSSEFHNHDGGRFAPELKPPLGQHFENSLSGHTKGPAHFSKAVSLEIEAMHKSSLWVLTGNRHGNIILNG